MANTTRRTGTRKGTQELITVKVPSPAELRSVDYEILAPHWPSVIRYMAHALIGHSFDIGKKGPVSSFMEAVRYLSLTDPKEMAKIIDEFKEERNAGTGRKRA